MNSLATFPIYPHKTRTFTSVYTVILSQNTSVFNSLSVVIYPKNKPGKSKAAYIVRRGTERLYKPDTGEGAIRKYAGAIDKPTGAA